MENPKAAEMTGDEGRFLLFCKEDAERPAEFKWCGVVVERRPVEGAQGEVMDLFMHASEEGLRLWFDGWLSGWRSGEFHRVRRSESNAE